MSEISRFFPKIYIWQVCTWKRHPTKIAIKNFIFKNMRYHYTPTENESHLVMSDSLQPHRLQPTKLHCPRNSLSQNAGVGSCSLLQGIFPTQGSVQVSCIADILYSLYHQGSPRILEWVAYCFSKASPQPRNQIRVSCIADRFFTS